ncbi:MAG: glutathione S-transferase N-terminal domain-containing protein [Acidobacteriota bacterium]
MRALQLASSLGATLSRFALGLSVGNPGKRPDQLLEVYEFENCPFCRKVREALSILDLDARIWPCPKNGPRYRPELIERGGKAQFPYLVDPNTGVEMYESDAIVRYLFETYGDGQVPLMLRRGPHNDFTTSMAALARPTSLGRFYREANPPHRELELYSFEASPFCRLVREMLTTLEIPYVLRNVAKGSSKREAFVALSGKMQVPFLVDANTGAEMFESADIVDYLQRTYAAR